MKPHLLFILVILVIFATGCASLFPATPTAPPVVQVPADAAPEQPAEQADVPETVVNPEEAPTPVPIDVYAGLYFQRGWARIPRENGFFGGYRPQQINDITAGGPGFVAGGFDMQTGDMDAAIWYSENGVEWLRVFDDPVFGGGGLQVIKGVAAGERGAVAVGRVQLEDGNSNAVVYYSGDGRTWVRVPDENGTFGDEHFQGMNRVLATSAGFFAVGSDETASEIRGAVWFSENGLDWERIPHDGGVFGNDRLYVVFSDVVQSGPVEGNDVDGSVWRSRDGGRNWVRLVDPGAAFGDDGLDRYQNITGAVATEAGIWVAGYESNIGGEPFVNIVIWYSETGESWERVFEHKPDFTNQWAADIIAAEDGFYAFGRESVGDQVSSAVWYSGDGFIWEQIPSSEVVFGGFGVQMITAGAAGPGQNVAVGYSEDPGDQDAAIWIFVPGR
jgi:hypothetical protein